VTTAQLDGVLKLMHAAFTELREASYTSDTKLVFHIADTFEILPELLHSDNKDRAGLTNFGAHILHPLVERYPRLERLERLWQAVGIS
jgi:hypothetical protein